MRVRLKDVAEASGVSIGTVSRVLNDADWRIAESTRERVRRAADRLGYIPNVAAQSLRTNRTRTIAALTDSIVTTSFAHKLIGGVQTVTAAAEYILMILSTGDDRTQRARAIEMLHGHSIEGLLVGAMYHRQLDGEGLPIGVPVVGLNGILDVEGAMSFVPDEFVGAQTATRYLLDAGHHDIAHITENPTDGFARDLRIGAFEKTIAASSARGYVHTLPGGTGLPLSRVAEEAAREILSREDRPTAVFAYNDLIALGILRAARRLRLSVPRDLSVIGFDDQAYVADEASPPLTTVRLPHEEMGRAAAAALLWKLGEPIDGRTWESGVHMIECPFVERESVAPPSNIQGTLG